LLTSSLLHSLPHNVIPISTCSPQLFDVWSFRQLRPCNRRRNMRWVRCPIFRLRRRPATAYPHTPRGF
jgi:hypothetical protein